VEKAVDDLRARKKEEKSQAVLLQNKPKRKIYDN
jgi:hypothetical protein